MCFYVRCFQKKGPDKHTGIKIVSAVTEFFPTFKVLKKIRYLHILDIAAEVAPYDFTCINRPVQ